MALGLVSSLGLWLWAVGSERALVQTQFRSAASNRVLAIGREIEGFARITRSTAAYLALTEPVDAAELASFLESIQGQPQVPIALGYRIHGKNTFHDPFSLVKQWPVAENLNSAFFIPCSKVNSTCLGIRIPASAGELTMIVAFGPLAERGLSFLSPHGVDIRLVESSKVRFEHLSRLRARYRSSEWESLRGGIEAYQAQWRLMNLDISIYCSAVPGILAAASTWQPWGVLIGGLVASALLATLFFSLLRHAEGVEKLVAMRTAELELARDEAVQASVLKSRFLANVSHEVRTPLNGVLGMTRFLLDSPLSSEQREYGLTIQSSGEMLLRLMNDLLDLSRIEAGQLELCRESFDLGQTIQSVIDNVAEIAHGKRLGFELNVSPGVRASFIGDSGRLSQILMNLLGNAIKFTESGLVRLNIRATENTLLLDVEDTGPGIDPVLLQRLFERFVQGDSSSARKYQGAGLGLAISRELVQMMGGKIWAESESGRGSKFHVELPQAQDVAGAQTLRLKPPRRYRPAAAQTPIADPESRPLTGGQRVLVAEDNHVNQLVTAGMLRRLGFQVDIANNGVEAVQAHEKNFYSAILMDCQMPEMDGFEATRQIRGKEGDLSRIPIIALTANAMQEDRQRCIDAHMDDHLSKPLNLQLLKEALERWCPIVA